MSRKKSTEHLIENQLRPHLSQLKEKLTEYTTLIQYQKEIEVLQQYAKQK